MNEKEIQNNIESLKSSYDNISLSLEEKETIKASILNKIDEKISSQKSVLSFWYFKNVGFALSVFVLIGAPISFAAENSLPGDLLYRVKTDFNESIAEIVTPEEEKADFYQSLINKRVTELKEVAEREETELEDVEEFKEVFLEDIDKSVEFSKKVKNEKEFKKDVLEDHAAILVALEEASELVEKIETIETVEQTEGEISVSTDIATTTDNIELVETNIESITIQTETDNLNIVFDSNASTTDEVLDELITEAENKIEKVSKDFLGNLE